MFRIFRSSFKATLISIFGAFFLLGGLMGLFSGAILPGIIALVVGFAINLKADSVAEKDVFKKWKKSVVENGYDRRIVAGDYSLAVQVYNQNPKPMTADYIASLNGEVGARLKAAIQEAKAAQK